MVAAIIVAAGKGTRMGGTVDKLFLYLAGRPLIAHTWQRFEETPCIDEIILVIRPDMQTAYSDVARQSRFRKPFHLANGGAERQDSVWNGLQALAPDCELVAIQDGARPCTPPSLIEATVQAARQYGAAVAAQRITDSIKESADGRTITRSVDRSRLWAVQTPQTFQVPLIKRAIEHLRTQQLKLTDDTAACEYIGHPVQLVESGQLNPKATSPSDVPLLEMLIHRQAVGGSLS